MALLKNFHNEQYDVTIANAYWKVEVETGIVGGKNKLRVRMACFKNKTIADTNQDKLGDFDFEFTPDLNSANNFIAQAYLYARTLPEFAGSIDA